MYQIYNLFLLLTSLGLLSLHYILFANYEITFYSISIFRSAVLVARLEVMVSFTETLPVRAIPEKLFISAVRNDVIHHCSLCVPPLLHTHGTQRMRGKELFACLLPGSVVSPAASWPDFLRMKALVLFHSTLYRDPQEPRIRDAGRELCFGKAFISPPC